MATARRGRTLPAASPARRPVTPAAGPTCPRNPPSTDVASVDFLAPSPRNPSRAATAVGFSLPHRPRPPRSRIRPRSVRTPLRKGGCIRRTNRRNTELFESRNAHGQPPLVLWTIEGFRPSPGRDESRSACRPQRGEAASVESAFSQVNFFIKVLTHYHKFYRFSRLI